MWPELFSDYTFRLVVGGSALIGGVSGALGCFAYLRKQSLVGDVVSHASLLGIVGAFCLSYLIAGVGNKSLLVLIPGAIFIGVLALLLTKLITQTTRIKEDAGLGLILAIFFGTGLTLLKWIQGKNSPIQGHAGLEDYLFGMAAAMTLDDLWMILILGGSAMLLLTLFWSRLKVLTFDAEYARSLGLPVHGLELLILCLMVVGIVIGLQIVGVILMTSMLIAPASAARQWTRHLNAMVCLAGLIGGCGAGLGAALSAIIDRMPTGPVIIIILTSFFLLSLFFSPERGLLIRKKSNVVY
ncbi:MAG: iron chelate uptake ABC transporter family permease subunit [Endozoicomonas sp. (ex Botrylloides leachii)]|nr:iron chelate uptake ABC transporter family permease subunit [Endozoicomonas sp. (ex Botrylloides leachii)]